MSELTSELKLAALRERFGSLSDVLEPADHPGFWCVVAEEDRAGEVECRYVFRGTRQGKDAVIDAAYSLLVAPDRERISDLEAKLAEVTARCERLRVVASAVVNTSGWDGSGIGPRELLDIMGSVYESDLDLLTPTTGEKTTITTPAEVYADIDDDSMSAEDFITKHAAMWASLTPASASEDICQFCGGKNDNIGAADVCSNCETYPTDGRE